MLIYPAIDLMGGEAVRLLRGEAQSRHVVGAPLELAERFAAAPLLHVVDLDGAFAGRLTQLDLLRELARRRPIQAGGGIRSADDVARLLDLGARRAVVGTAAIEDPALVDTLLERWGADRLVVAMDVKDGRVAVAGWTDTSAHTPEVVAARLAAQGVTWVLCTAVHLDGTLEGPDVDVLRRVQAAGPGLRVIASGGIGSLDDVRACRAFAAVVVGKAIYAGRFTLEEALAC